MSRPDLAQNLLRTVSNILSSNVTALGQIAQRYVDSAGNILVRTFDGVTGDLISIVKEGTVLTMPEVGSFATPLGTVSVRRDVVSGLLIEVLSDGAGTLINAKVVQ